MILTATRAGEVVLAVEAYDSLGARPLWGTEIILSLMAG